MDADELPAEPAAGPPLMDDSEAAVETDSSWSGGGKSGSSFWAQQRQRSASLTRTDSLAAVRMETERELQAHYAGTDPGSGGDDEDDASNLSDEDNTSYEYIRWRVACYFESDVVEAVMLLATFYVLFATDIRLAVTEVAADVGFESLYILAFSLFGAELVLCSWAKEGYWLSFFWWLDLVATLSLVLDISFFWDPIGAAITSVADNGPSATDNGAAVASHVSQSARAGSRAGRVVRMVKLLRLFRFAKVQRWLRYFLAAVRYRCSNGAERAELGLSRTLSVSSLGEGRRRAAAASQAAEVLEEQITKQTILGVLLFIIAVAVLNVDAVNDRPAYQAHLLRDVAMLLVGDPDAATLLVVRERLVSFWGVLRLETCSGQLAIDNAARIQALRPGEELHSLALSYMGCTVSTVFDVKADSVLAAKYSLGFTSFVVAMLITLVYAVSLASSKYCIQPIENIMQMMADFANNPLDKMKTLKITSSEHAETSELVQSISKIASLLQIGFGEAGAAIIGNNLRVGGEINPMTPGRTMVGLFGFVVILGFTETTEALREVVMLYVNRIAAIVHSCVHEFSGAINKNIGEAFLMVWPLEHRNVKREKLFMQSGNSPNPRNRDQSMSRGKRFSGLGEQANSRGKRQSRCSIGPHSPFSSAPPGSPLRFKTPIVRQSSNGSIHSPYAHEGSTSPAERRSSSISGRRGGSSSPTKSQHNWQPASPSKFNRVRCYSNGGGTPSGGSFYSQANSGSQSRRVYASRLNKRRTSTDSTSPLTSAPGTPAEPGEEDMPRLGRSSSLPDSYQARKEAWDRAHSGWGGHSPSLCSSMRSGMQSGIANTPGPEVYSSFRTREREKYRRASSPILPRRGAQVTPLVIPTQLLLPLPPSQDPSSNDEEKEKPLEEELEMEEYRTHQRRLLKHHWSFPHTRNAGRLSTIQSSCAGEEPDNSIRESAREKLDNATRESAREKLDNLIKESARESRGAREAIGAMRRTEIGESAAMVSGLLDSDMLIATHRQLSVSQFSAGTSEPSLTAGALKSLAESRSESFRVPTLPEPLGGARGGDVEGRGGTPGGVSAILVGVDTPDRSTRAIRRYESFGSGSGKREGRISWSGSERGCSPQSGKGGSPQGMQELSFLSGTRPAPQVLYDDAPDAPPLFATRRASSSSSAKEESSKSPKRRGAGSLGGSPKAHPLLVESFSQKGDLTPDLSDSASQPSPGSFQRPHAVQVDEDELGSEPQGSSFNQSGPRRLLATSITVSRQASLADASASASPNNQRRFLSSQSSPQLTPLPGSPFLNVDRFLVETPFTPHGRTEDMFVVPETSQRFTTADCAVAGFCLCVLLVKGNEELKQLCLSEQLQKIRPGFSVETGYGLHMGWAIEGAIGSDLKIDASYLSPNVNLASRLEAATKQYGVRILVSEQVASVMSRACQDLLRKVDRVTVKGSARPITLYTLDIAEDATNVRLAKELDPQLRTGEEREAEDAARRWVRQVQVAEGDDAAEEIRDEETEHATDEAVAEITKEERMFRRVAEIFQLRRTVTPEFLHVWDGALDLYTKGKWKEAYSEFEMAQFLLPDDGPTRTLMGYIKRRDCEAPEGWTGVRELTSK